MSSGKYFMHIQNESILNDSKELTNKTDIHDIAEILFKVALNTITLVEPSSLPVDRKY
jgi:hypothetical protein